VAWPRRLAAWGLMDGVQRRVALLRGVAERCKREPPPQVIVAAGSTGTTPAAADLIAAIGRAPRGCVVLPGLDRSLADNAWDEVGEQHPQGALKRLIDRAGLPRAQVADWGPATEAAPHGRWRRRVINEALRPPDSTADWLDQIRALKTEGEGRDPIREGLEGLRVIACRDEEEEARIAALIMREALETPGRSCALITPDMGLARRASAMLSRWGVAVDSSAGRPLAGTPVAVLMALVAKARADPLDPPTLLAIVKHPLVRLRFTPADIARARRILERQALRGARCADWPDLEDRLVARPSHHGEPATAERAAALREAAALLGRLRRALERAAPPEGEEVTSGAAAGRALAEAMEALAEGPDGGTGDLWGGSAGERAAALLASLIEESQALPAATRVGFAELLTGLLAAEAVPSGAPAHPRLKIMGVLEARLISADLLVLAGLEEGVWPQGAPIDPFLSRPMRARLGLPAPERRIGLSAHDFAQAASAPRVVLLHAERRAGAPAVASRWLWRLATLAEGAKVPLASRSEVVAWARAIDAPLASPPAHLATASCPRPAPPLDARPRKLAVTQVETWVRDPYAIYARFILGLRPMARPDEPIGARERGSAVHRAFERFARAHPEVLPDAAEAIFAELLIEELRAAGMPERHMAWERARADRMAPWAMAFERDRRPGARLLVEQSGSITFGAAAGPFTLTAKADRIEAREGLADIVDFKTGTPPSAKEVKAGLAPQLTLTGAILQAGGFADLGASEPGELLYVQVSGGRVAGLLKSRALPPESAALARAAVAGLRRRIAWFDDPKTPYRSWASPKFERFAGDYDHLARVWEWRVIGESEEATG
ncbi:MAG: double-strand break repair protein AddB, partial [Caulobacteraceae bacterium]